ncbi:MAG: HEAT repeat domain-containing protein [Bacteroidales bacterium]|nr:HEAT repeat domain-containing protein [Bacteroidales bacterium]
MTPALFKFLTRSFIQLVLVSFLYTTGINLQAQAISAAEIRTEMGKILDVLTAYDYDKSRSWLPDLQHLMMEVYKNPEALSEVEPLMIEFLQSDARAAGKQYVCRELGVIGTASSVPVLSELLVAPGMAGTALLALEKIPGAQADQALLKVLVEEDEVLQIAVINSLAARQVTAAIIPLTRLMRSDNEKLALSAISALGSIAGAEAAKNLYDFSDEAPASLKWAVLDARLKCADRFMEGGDKKNAAIIYEKVYQADPPETLKYNALAGKFKTSSEDPYNFILNHLRQEDPEFHPYIIQLAYQLDDGQKLGRIFDDMRESQNIPTLHLFAALASIGDFSVHQEVIASLVDREEEEDVRMAAIRALASIGEPSDALLLAELAASAKGPEKELARQSLYMLPGSKTNEKIRSGIREETGDIRAELIRSTGERNMDEATELLFEFTSDPDPNVRMESIRALGKLASPEILSDLITVLMQTDTRRERQEAERAIYAVTQKMPENADQSASIIGALGNAEDPEVLASLINIIGMIGDGKDLDVLREYLESGEEGVQLAVIRALSGWPDAGPMEDLKQLASSTDDQRKHTLALRGYVDVVLADNQMSNDDKFREIRHAYDLSTSTAEFRIVISGLSRIGSLEALDMAVRLLENPELRKEAEAAVVRIAEQTSWAYPKETTRRLNLVLKKINNKEVEQRIHRILDRIN